MRLLAIMGFLALYTLFLHAVALTLLVFIADPAGGGLEAIEILMTPSEWEPGIIVLVSPPVLIMVATQMVFLWPVLRRRPEMAPTGRPLWTTLVAGGLVAAVLCSAMLLSFIDLTMLWAQDGAVENAYQQAIGVELDEWVLLLPMGLIAASWAVWTLLLSVFTRRRPGCGRLSRLVGVLLGCTILELLVTIPIDVMVRRRAECYCATGSFVSICCSAWALLWLAGPGAIVALLSKRRRLFVETNCPHCGYPKHSAAGSTCPECGQSWST
jgi:hypothetical protein